MSWEIFVFLIIFGVGIIFKLIKYKLNIQKIKKDGLKIIKDLSLIIGEYLGFLTGFGITICFINDKTICGISDLNILIIGMGILMIGASFVGYLYSITKDFTKKKKK